ELDKSVKAVQAHRWALKFRTGFQQEEIKIPQRFLEVETWKGKMDPDYLYKLKEDYQKVLKEIAHRHTFTDEQEKTGKSG
ncbi:MAG: hypothetical protein ACLFRQ_05420, partial [Desulfonatronovibrio sp.]